MKEEINSPNFRKAKDAENLTLENYISITKELF